MTESDWWKQIEQFTLQKDWNGLLVAADGLQELGMEQEADTIRWAVRKGTSPVLFGDSWWNFCLDDCWDTCQKAWRVLAVRRAKDLEFWS